MKVIRGYSTHPEQPLTKPFLSSNGLFIEFRGGDVCDPVQIGLFGGKWFEPPYPKHVWRWFCRYPLLPFISWRLGGKGGYIGFKAYGADSPAYKNWMNPDDVYDGSQALCLSIRPFATMRD
jgi:hypothetical protein